MKGRRTWPLSQPHWVRKSCDTKAPEWQICPHREARPQLSKEAQLRALREQGAR